MSVKEEEEEEEEEEEGEEGPVPEIVSNTYIISLRHLSHFLNVHIHNPSHAHSFNNTYIMVHFYFNTFPTFRLSLPNQISVSSFKVGEVGRGRTKG